MWNLQPLQPKQMTPDYDKSQHENHSHSRTRLPDYHESAANVTNSAFYSNCAAASCSSHSGAAATCKQELPKQGERERPTKRHLKVASMHMEVRALFGWIVWRDDILKLAPSRFLGSSRHWRCANTTGPSTLHSEPIATSKQKHPAILWPNP